MASTVLLKDPTSPFLAADHFSSHRTDDLRLIASDGTCSYANSALLSLLSSYGPVLREAFDQDAPPAVSVELTRSEVDAVVDFVHHGVVACEPDEALAASFLAMGIALPGKKFEKVPLPRSMMQKKSYDDDDLSNVEQILKTEPADFEVIAKIDEDEFSIGDLEDIPSEDDESSEELGEEEEEEEDPDFKPKKRKRVPPIKYEQMELGEFEDEDDEEDLKPKRKKRGPRIKKEPVPKNPDKAKHGKKWNIVDFYPKNRSDREPGVCTKCQLQVGHLPAHLEHIHSLENTTCDKCGRVYKDKYARDKHRQQSHMDLCCELCGKVLGSMHTMRQHMTAIHASPADRPFKCELCPKAYVQRGKLNEHIQNSHSKERNHICELCGTAHSTKTALSLHRLQKHNIRVRQQPTKKLPFSPSDFVMGPDGELRPRKFKHPTNKKPPGERRTKGRSLTAEEWLAQGVRFVAKSESYCTVCDRKFTGPQCEQRTRYHYLSKHASEEEKPFPCDVCGKRFVRKEVRNDHMHIHENKKSFACSFCSASFNQLANRNAHERTVHLGIKKGEVGKSRRNAGCNKAAPETAEDRRVRWAKAREADEAEGNDVDMLHVM